MNKLLLLAFSIFTLSACTKSTDMAIDAGITKLHGGDWFFYGTGALIVFQAGLCLVIDAARFK